MLCGKRIVFDKRDDGVPSQFLTNSVRSGMYRFDRLVRVSVLGEILDRIAAFRELFHTLKPDGILAIVEVIFDPHFQTRKAVTTLSAAAGLEERAFFNHRLAYVIHFAKPTQ